MASMELKIKAQFEELIRLKEKIEDTKKALKDVNKHLEPEKWEQLAKVYKKTYDEHEKVNKSMQVTIHKMEKMDEATKKAFSPDVLLENIKIQKRVIADLEKQYEKAKKAFEKTNFSSQDPAFLKMREEALKAFRQTRSELDAEKKALEELEKQYVSTSNKAETYLTQLRKIEQEMVELQLSGQKESARYKQLEQELSRVGTAYNQVRKERELLTKAGNAWLSGMLSGLTGLSGAFAAGQGVMSLFVKDNERLASVQKNLQAAMSITIGLQQVSNTLHETSAFRVNTMTKITQLFTVAQTRLAVALGISTVAAKVLMATLTLGISIAITGVIYLIDKYISANNKAAEAQKKFRDAVVSASQDQIAGYEKLRTSYNKLGDDLKKKEMFIVENQEAFKQLGVQINNVNEADNLFIKNTESFKRSIIERAKAAAAMELAAEKYKETIAKMIEAESLPDKVERLIYKPNKKPSGNPLSVFSKEYVSNPKKEEKIQEAKVFQEEAKKLLDLHLKFNEDADRLVDESNIELLNRLEKGTKAYWEAYQKIQENALIKYQKGSKDWLKAKEEYDLAAEKLKLWDFSGKQGKEQIEALEGSVKKIKESLSEAQKELELAVTDEERIKFKELISGYEEELKSLQDRIALLGHDVVLNAIDGIIKGVNVAIGKFDSRTAQEKLFGVLDTSDLDKFRKNSTKGVKRSVSEWNDLEQALSRVNSQIEEVASNIGGTAGEVLKSTSVVVSSTLSMLNSITRLSELSSQSIEKGASLAAVALQAVEKASVILAIISAAMQIMQQLSELIADAHQQYLKFAEKVNEINKMRDAVNEYRLAVMEAQKAEKGWFATDNLNSLRDARKMHEEIKGIYDKKIEEEQAKYQNQKGGGWFTGSLNYGLLGGIDALFGTNILGNKYDKETVKAIENLRIETRKKSSGFLGSGIGAKNQKTEDLQTWINQNKDLFKGKDTNLFDSDNLLNKELAESILKNYGDKLVGQTKETLETLVELKEKYDEYINQLHEYVSSLYEPLVDNFVDSLWDWFDEGKDALDSFKDYAKDTFRDIVSDMMRSIILKNVVGTYSDEIADLYEKYAKGNLTEEELAKLVADRTDKLANTFDEQIPVLQDTMTTITDAFKNIGFDLKNTDTSSSDNTLKGAYSKASQESINLLAGQTGAARVTLEDIRRLMQLLYGNSEANTANVLQEAINAVRMANENGWESVRAMSQHVESIAQTNNLIAQNTASINALSVRIAESNDAIKISSKDSADSLNTIVVQGVKPRGSLRL